MKIDKNINQIMLAVKKLPKNQQISLKDKINSFVGDIKAESNTSKLTTLAGLGADLWTDLNVSKHLDESREW